MSIHPDWSTIRLQELTEELDIINQFRIVSEAGNSRSHRPLTDPEFIKFHLAISAQEYRRQQRSDPARKQHRASLEERVGLPVSGEYGYPPLREDDQITMDIQRLEHPTYDGFMKRLEAVGQEFGWYQRIKYKSKDLVETMLSHPDSEFLTFNVNGQEVGFTLITSVDTSRPKPANTDGAKLHKPELVRDFIDHENIRSEEHGLGFREIRRGAPAMEIYKFAMYESFASYGYGNFFLPAVMHRVFEKHDASVLYLDTRDTNPVATLKFYLNNGLRIIATETLPNDLDHTIGSFHPRFGPSGGLVTGGNGKHKVAGPAGPDPHP